MFKIISKTSHESEKRNLLVEGGGRLDIVLEDLSIACAIIFNRAIKDSEGSIGKNELIADFMLKILSELENQKNK